MSRSTGLPARSPDPGTLVRIPPFRVEVRPRDPASSRVRQRERELARSGANTNTNLPHHRIAYSSYQDDGELYDWEICILDLDTGVEQQITNNVGGDWRGLLSQERLGLPCRVGGVESIIGEGHAVWSGVSSSRHSFVKLLTISGVVVAYLLDEPSAVGSLHPERDDAQRKRLPTARQPRIEGCPGRFPASLLDHSIV